MIALPLTPAQVSSI